MSTVVLTSPSSPKNGWTDPDVRLELVDGVEIEVPPMSAYSAEVGNRMYEELTVFLHQSALGKAQHETLFRLPLPKSRNRIPDVAFTSYERWPKDRPFPYRGNPRDVVPDLAVEVISPNDLVEEITSKLDDYFDAGVRLVWIVHCKQKCIDVYEARRSMRVLTETDELDGGNVLPGFRTLIAALFPPTTPDEPATSDQ